MWRWAVFGTLLAADKLALINDSRAVLRLSPDAQELLLRSSLEIGDEVDYWLSRMADPAQRASVLADKARTRAAGVRRRRVRHRRCRSQAPSRRSCAEDRINGR